MTTQQVVQGRDGWRVAITETISGLTEMKAEALLLLVSSAMNEMSVKHGISRADMYFEIVVEDDYDNSYAVTCELSGARPATEPEIAEAKLAQGLRTKNEADRLRRRLAELEGKDA
jgi:hypothetical protein